MFVALAAGVTLWLQPKVAPDRLTVTALAVGRGSATLIELPGGQTLLYDAGTSFPSDVGRNTITPFLRHSDIARIEGVYISHANLDHFSGLPSVLDEVTAGPLLLNRYFEPSSPAHSPAQHFLAVLSQRGHPVEQFGVAPLSWESGGVTFELFWPPAGLDDTWSANNTSTVLRLTFASRSILLTGDIEEEAQQALIQRGDLHADVLFLPHHGSVAKTLKSFLVAVNPQIVIRSHFERMRETTNGLEDIVGSIPIYNTADHGAVEIRVEREGIRVIPMIPPSKGGT